MLRRSKSSTGSSSTGRLGAYEDYNNGNSDNSNNNSNESPLRRRSSGRLSLMSGHDDSNHIPRSRSRSSLSSSSSFHYHERPTASSTAPLSPSSVSVNTPMYYSDDEPPISSREQQRRQRKRQLQQQQRQTQQSLASEITAKLDEPLATFRRNSRNKKNEDDSHDNNSHNNSPNHSNNNKIQRRGLLAILFPNNNNRNHNTNNINTKYFYYVPYNKKEQQALPAASVLNQDKRNKLSRRQARRNRRQQQREQELFADEDEDEELALMATYSSDDEPPTTPPTRTKIFAPRWDNYPQPMVMLTNGGGAHPSTTNTTSITTVNDFLMHRKALALLAVADDFWNDETSYSVRLFQKLLQVARLATDPDRMMQDIMTNSSNHSHSTAATDSSMTVSPSELGIILVLPPTLAQNVFPSQKPGARPKLAPAPGALSSSPSTRRQPPQMRMPIPPPWLKGQGVLLLDQTSVWIRTACGLPQHVPALSIIKCSSPSTPVNIGLHEQSTPLMLLESLTSQASGGGSSAAALPPPRRSLGNFATLTGERLSNRRYDQHEELALEWNTPAHCARIWLQQDDIVKNPKNGTTRNRNRTTALTFWQRLKIAMLFPSFSSCCCCCC